MGARDRSAERFGRYLPAPSVEAEVAAIVAEHPELPSLLTRQPDEPARPEMVMLRKAPMPFFMVPVPIPDRPGMIFASRCPARGGHYVLEDLDALEREGISRIVCLVPTEPLEQLHGVDGYLPEARERFGARFHQVDVLDHQLPATDEGFNDAVAAIDTALRDGERVLVHCIAGCGRTGMFVASLMVLAGLDPVAAIRRFRRHRRCGPDTVEQMAYAIRFARRFAPPTAEPEPEHERTWAWLAPVDRVWPMSDPEGRPHVLARGGTASVLLGRMRLKNGAIHRVAIKQPRIPWRDDQAEAMQATIEALVAAGVRLPRMFLHLLGDESVVVSQLFGGRARGSRLRQPSQYYRHLSPEERLRAVGQLTRVANAGYAPALDLFVVLEPEPWQAIPIDLDLIHREPDAGRRVWALMRCAMQISDEPAERTTIVSALRTEATGDTAAALERELSDRSSVFRRYWDPARRA